MNTFLSLSLSLARAPYYRSVVRVSRKPDLETRILRPGSAPWVLIPHCDLEEVTSFLRLSFSLFSNGEKELYLTFLLGLSNRWGKKPPKILNAQCIIAM